MFNILELVMMRPMGSLKVNVRLDQQNSTVTFSQDNVALVKFNLVQENPRSFSELQIRSPRTALLG